MSSLKQKIKKKLKFYYSQQEEYWKGKRIIQNNRHAAPNFMIIGAARAGTTSLFQYLAQHPQIIAPEKKDSSYFKKSYQATGIHSYLKGFPLTTDLQDKLTFEASSYIHEEGAVERISNLFPNMKFILLLRNPIKRAYSNWNFYHDKSKVKNRTPFQDNRSFAQAVEEELRNTKKIYIPTKFRYLEKGLYAEQLKDWYKFYSPENILLLDFDELKNDPKSLLKKTTNFLSINYTYADFFETNIKLEGTNKWKLDKSNNKEIKQYNATPYKKLIDEELEDKLRTFYKPTNIALEKLIGHKFSWME